MHPALVGETGGAFDRGDRGIGRPGKRSAGRDPLDHDAAAFRDRRRLREEGVGIAVVRRVRDGHVDGDAEASFLARGRFDVIDRPPAGVVLIENSGERLKRVVYPPDIVKL
jgi:hypothetical protein